jgi:hypothetical protein
MLMFNRKDKPNSKELADMVEQGLAYRCNGRFFATDLAYAIQWAQDNFPNGGVPEGGVRYKGYLITALETDTEITFNLDRITQ